MRRYRIYHLDGGGRVIAGTIAECSTDDDAIAVAMTMLASSDQVEIWAGTTCIGLISAAVPARPHIAPDTLFTVHARNSPAPKREYFRRLAESG